MPKGAGDTTVDNAAEEKSVVPFQEGQVALMPEPPSARSTASELSPDMGPMMEEMESVLYSISFGK